jgi:hypothetical protein
MLYEKVPRYKVNLDEGPDRRWNEIMDRYQHRCKKVLSLVDSLLGNFINRFLLKTMINYYADKFFYIEELRAISERGEIPLDKLLIMQLCYEMFASCTSIIINDNDGTIHYRTMDWDMKELVDLTIIIDFMRNNEIVFTATSWAGYVGVLTAAKQNVCSIAVNYRRMNDGILENFRHSINGSWPIGFLIRHILEKETKFNKISEIMEKAPLISPCYISLAGVSKGSGLIISRTRNNSDKCEKLTVEDNDFLVQTNIDNDRINDASVENIMYSIERLQKVISLMKNYNNNNLMNMFNVWPIINDTTIYVSVMEAATGINKSMIVI